MVRIKPRGVLSRYHFTRYTSIFWIRVSLHHLILQFLLKRPGPMCFSKRLLLCGLETYCKPFYQLLQDFVYWPFGALSTHLKPVGQKLCRKCPGSKMKKTWNTTWKCLDVHQWLHQHIALYFHLSFTSTSLCRQDVVPQLSGLRSLSFALNYDICLV